MVNFETDDYIERIIDILKQCPCLANQEDGQLQTTYIYIII